MPVDTETVKRKDLNGATIMRTRGDVIEQVITAAKSLKRGLDFEGRISRRATQNVIDAVAVLEEFDADEGWEPL